MCVPVHCKLIQLVLVLISHCIVPVDTSARKQSDFHSVVGLCKRQIVDCSEQNRGEIQTADWCFSTLHGKSENYKLLYVCTKSLKRTKH